MKSQDSHYHSYNISPESLLAEMETLLKKLVQGDFPSPHEENFQALYNKFLSLYDFFQEEVLILSGQKSVCSAGCSRCCRHWAEEVYSFEAAIAAEYIRENIPGEIDAILRILHDSMAAYEKISGLIDGKPVTDNDGNVSEDMDPLDLTLACFYQLGIPCPMLDSTGSCRIYPVRPLACRIYINVRDAVFCEPERIHSGEEATCIIDPGETVDKLLEHLHRRYDSSQGLSALRPLLARYLEK
ncbi:MAG: hypothetical protein CVV44_04970 [Spirochaetae bacterium HGW-Spirochaetae-1]|nr:MAG: hypothetical protein CVV44_04970 [Spirochaetae bacterium HGW-Spirochaetae-1]